MFRIHIRSKKELPQHREYGYNDEMYGYDGYDNNQHDRYEAEAAPSACCICGDAITNGHLVFIINDKEYEIHTSCMVTGVALIANGITLLIGFIKQGWRGKDQEQIEGE